MRAETEEFDRRTQTDTTVPFSELESLEKDPILEDFGSAHVRLPCGSGGIESADNVGDLGSIPESRRSPGEGNGNPLHYFCQENFEELDVTEQLTEHTHTQLHRSTGLPLHLQGNPG
ncbi:unnamed protein product [Rangifer tarandus platyrhynchus]|uniref:Uncharacterized protein n=1 Tax=Rangifer tarandus platyrhynchus TaxID=3082113 RepID=A0AC59ZIG9_RANTA